jgi:hypothetical protein
MLLRRRRILIFDDVTRLTGMKAGANRHHVTHYVLKYISGFERKNNVIIITSNEGLQWAFSDGNSSVRTIVSMPRARREEVVEALKRMGLCNCPSTTDFDRVCQCWGPECAHSTRFWYTVATKSAERDLTSFLQELRSEKTSREFIWRVALDLDLQCEATFPLLALGQSRPVKFTDLAGLFPAYPTVAKDAEKLIGESGAPRRLALATMLAVTADPVTERNLLKKLLGKLPLLAAETDGVPPQGDEIVTFDSYVRPLRTRLTSVYVAYADNPALVACLPVAGYTIRQLCEALRSKLGNFIPCPAELLKIRSHGKTDPLPSDAIVIANTLANPYVFEMPPLSQNASDPLKHTSTSQT